MVKVTLDADEDMEQAVELVIAMFHQRGATISHKKKRDIFKRRPDRVTYTLEVDCLPCPAGSRGER